MTEKKQILVVDDAEETVVFISQILEDNGYQFQVANTGKKAMTAMRGEKPDLVLLDLMMPRGGGIFVLREMKKDSDLKDIPVIIITGTAEATGVDLRTGKEQPRETYADSYQREMGARIHSSLKGLNPDALLEKPIDPKLLVDTIRRLTDAQPWQGDHV